MKSLILFLFSLIIHSLNSNHQKGIISGVIYCIVASQNENELKEYRSSKYSNPDFFPLENEYIYLYETQVGWFGNSDVIVGQNTTNSLGEFYLLDKGDKRAVKETYLWVNTPSCRSPLDKKRSAAPLSESVLSSPVQNHLSVPF